MSGDTYLNMCGTEKVQDRDFAGDSLRDFGLVESSAGSGRVSSLLGLEDASKAPSAVVGAGAGSSSSSSIISSPYTSGCSLKQSCMALNFSTQLIPFGSSSEKTKQEKASRNWGPQGPCAIPPRHGQSQFISPVTGLKAPADPASFCDASPSAFVGGRFVVSSDRSGAPGVIFTSNTGSEERFSDVMGITGSDAEDAAGC